MTAAGVPPAGARWWRSHSVRVRLTFWYVGAMIVVLGVYVGAVYLFVSRNASEALNRQLRQDFTWVYASLYLDDFGEYMLNEPERLDPDFPLPWVQVWRGDRTIVVFRNQEARARLVPESRSIPEGIVELDTVGGRMRILTQRGALSNSRVVIQVGRLEAPMKAELRDLALIFFLGLPLAVAGAGIGGYMLARRARRRKAEAAGTTARAGS